MSRMAVELALLPQALSKGKIKRREIDLPLTITVAAHYTVVCVPQREKEGKRYIHAYAVHVYV